MRRPPSSSLCSRGAHALSIMFALLGLICAGVAACLILKLGSDAAPSSTVMDYYSFQDMEDSLEDVYIGGDTIDFDELVVETVFEVEPKLLRGRRLVGIVDGDVVPLSNVPSSSPSGAPSSFPTYIIIHDQDPPKDTSFLMPTDNDRNVATETIVPAIIVGLASSVVVCSLLLYASDVRDRHQHWAKQQQQQQQLQQQAVMDDNSSQKSSRLDRQSMTTTSAASSAETSGYYIHARVSNEIVEYRGGNNTDNRILPPMIADRPALDYEEMALQALEAPPVQDNDDDVSISRVSTLTTSLVEGGYYGGYASYADIEEKMNQYGIESSSDGNVTELSDKFRVADTNTALATLVAANSATAFPSDEEDDATIDASVCSSLTGGTNATSSTPHLRGESCLERKGTSSLEVSPDTPQMDDHETPEKGQDGGAHPRRVKVDGDEELSQLEQLISRIPVGNVFSSDMASPQANASEKNDDEMRDGREDVVPTAEEESFVRDIYFVPCAEGSPSLGLYLSDAVSPEAWATISKVDSVSPLVGRVFERDSILSVNDVDTTGRSGKEVLLIIDRTHPHINGVDKSAVAGAKMIKLTVMSIESDGGSLSDGQQSFDLGQPESGIEI